MGAAGRMWEEAKHPRAFGGKFAKKSVDVSEIRNSGVRASAAFQPRPTARQRRALKEEAPAAWRSAKALYDKRDRGQRLTSREAHEISWASPRRIAEQVAKTGDAVVPRGEAVARVRATTRGRSGDSRRGARDLIVRSSRTGKLEARRGTRDVELPDGRVVGAKRARRSFDLKPRAKQPKAKPQYTASQFAAVSDAKIREIATSMGIVLPKRAGRNQIIKLIVGD